VKYILYLHWRSCPREISQIWLESKGGEVENFRIPPISWQLVGSYSLNMAILDFLALIMWRLVLIFPPQKKTFCLSHMISLRRRILYTRIYPVKPRCENRAFPSSFTYLILHGTVSCEWVERRRSRAKRELRSPASVLSPLVAAVWDPRTQPQHAQLLQG
jgi:hypothetical protein